MTKVLLRINGRGNAWPVPLGQEHPFYSPNLGEDYANASFSIISVEGDSIAKETIKWEVLIDAGHGIVPFLLKHNNRIPEAIVLTHPHFDHILGIDWIIQSYYRFNDKKAYPVYATKPCWNTILRTLPHLRELVNFFELKPGEETGIKSIADLEITSYPVYHGEHAPGASLLSFRVASDTGKTAKAVFSGDLLLPLLRNEDYACLTNADYLIADGNNRFPYPRTNHWSITDPLKLTNETDFFNTWKAGLSPVNLITPHIHMDERIEDDPYFSVFMEEQKKEIDQPYNVFEFVSRIKPENTLLVHYGGWEDKKYYNQEILNDTQLEKWITQEAVNKNIPTRFIVPKVGETFLIT
ncbi:MAG: MBL fold metallo-hydrolase [Bacteroidales bacterium]|nr:MBL fold metallo-hydrolase [Bacteroidales bacterium]